MEVLRYILIIVLGICTTALLAGVFAEIPIFDIPAIGALFGFGLFVGSIALWYYILGVFFGKMQSTVSNLKQNIEDRKEIERLTQITRQNEQEYVTAKRSYQYFSDLKIKEHLKFEPEQNPMERLALEEVAVERGIIDHSPMHEKLQHLKRFFR
ncbi:MAG: hypothetical protein ACK48V_10910 [Crocinitomicaceae bacterium]|jgi:hypothetical protein